MFVHGCDVLIVSPFDSSLVSEVLDITKNVLNKWNKRFSNDRKMFFFLDTNSGVHDLKDNKLLKDADLLIFLYNSNEENGEIISNIQKATKERGNKATLIYCKNSKIFESKIESSSYLREYSQEEFEFDLTCDISAFPGFNTASIIEFETVDIKLEGSWEETEVTYLVSCIFYSPEKPAQFKDRAIFSLGNIKSFMPRDKIISEQKTNKKNQKWKYVDYQFNADSFDQRTIYITYQIIVKEDLRSKEIKIHIPYETEHLFVNINTEKIQEKDFNMKVYPSYLDDNNNKQQPSSTIKVIWEDNDIHHLELSKVSANSIIKFTLK